MKIVEKIKERIEKELGLISSALKIVEEGRRRKEEGGADKKMFLTLDEWLNKD